jgi:formamidopyrimidine-DNA glycosylase
VPEGLEVEWYRRSAVAVVGRTVRAVVVDERVVTPDVAPALVGATFTAADRIGKLLLLRTDGPDLALHFGMTGRLVVDGAAVIDRLEYGSARDDPSWDRLEIELADGGVLRLNDPRRWARVGLDPDTTTFGPDLFEVTEADLAGAMRRRRAPLKALLLDQHVVAGLGNMCVDEVLWHAGLAPTRPGGSLDGDDVRELHRVIATELPAMLERGGSHTGTIDPVVRAAIPPCPIDGAPLVRSSVAGRTTVWCPSHQR